MSPIARMRHVATGTSCCFRNRERTTLPDISMRRRVRFALSVSISAARAHSNVQLSYFNCRKQICCLRHHALQRHMPSPPAFAMMEGPGAASTDTSTVRPPRREQLQYEYEYCKCSIREYHGENKSVHTENKRKIEWLVQAGAGSRLALYGTSPGTYEHHPDMLCEAISHL